MIGRDKSTKYDHTENPMKLTVRTVPEAISAIRTHLGWSRERLARELAVSNHSVFRYEKGCGPEPVYLKRLGSLCAEHGRHDLCDVFMAAMLRQLEFPEELLQKALRQLVAEI